MQTRAVIAKISKAKMHDKKFLQYLNPLKGSMLAFDKAYNYYRQFAEWTEEDVYSVYRLKDNAKAEVQEVLFEIPLGKDEQGVYRIEHIHLKYKKEKQEKILCLRMVYYLYEQGRKYKFITNNWDITAEEVALIYKTAYLLRAS